MKSGNEIKGGAIISYASLLIGNLIPFLYTPIMLRMLGKSEYGLYGIANSFMGYIGLLNFGVGGTIVRYLSKYRAEGDKEKESRVAGLFIKIYGVIALLMLIAGLILAVNIDIYRRSLLDQEVNTLRILIILMTINASFFLPFSVFNSIILAYERFIFSKMVGLVLTIATPLLNLMLLLMGFGSVGLVVSTTITNLIVYTVYLVYTIRQLEFRISFRKVETGLLSEVLRFSAFVFLASVVDIMYWSTDKLIIGWAIGASATAVYSIGATFNTYIVSLSNAISGLLVPRLTEMATTKTAKEEFTNIFIKVGRLQFILISFIVSAFISFGRQFIVIWAGPDYLEAYYVALLVMIPVTIPLIQNTGINILYALNKHQFRSITYLFVACGNVLLTLLWVGRWGIVGAAMATCVAYVIGNVVIINVYYHRVIGIDIPLFWKNIIRMSPVMIVMGTASYLIMLKNKMDGWGSFFAWAAVYTVLYFVLAYCFMMNTYERNLLMNPLQRIAAKVARRQV